MIFCQNCFKDPEIMSIVKKTGRIGNCPICESEDVSLYDTDRDTSLNAIFDDLLSVYTAAENLPRSHPKEDTQSLTHALKNDWSIFGNISDSKILDILKAISPDIFQNYRTIFEQPVGIREKYDSDYLKEHSILRTQEWKDFVQAIKHDNRFHLSLINTNLLKDYCLCISEDISADKHRFYRGRIAHDKIGFKPSEIGAPPSTKTVDGRANSAGISRLYLTDKRETTLHEIRAAEYDYVTVGTFKLLRPIKVVNLKEIAKISPFNSVTEVDCTALAINREHLQKINKELSRPMRRGDSVLDYLPTQYIADFIKSITDDNGKPLFDGIKYQSAMHSKGSNLTIFNPELFKCTYCNTYEVTKLNYHMETIVRKVKE